MNPKLNWEPVEVVEDWGDVISAAGGDEHAGGGALDR